MAVRIEKSGSVWTVIHSRPEARNAMDPKSADDLVAAFEQFDADKSANVAVFWGEGGAFCAGWDLKTVSDLDQSNPVGRLDFPKDGGKAPRGPLGPSRLEMSKPVIAAVEGPAVAGGMELAMWCDVRVMAESAYFGVYCRRWGVPLIDGGTVRLPRLVGQGKALEIIMTGRKVTAEESYRIGLCEKVVPHGKAREAAEAMAQEIARFPQECMRSDRLSVYRAYGKIRAPGSGERVGDERRHRQGRGHRRRHPLRRGQGPPRRLQEHLDTCAPGISRRDSPGSQEKPMLLLFWVGAGACAYLGYRMQDWWVPAAVAGVVAAGQFGLFYMLRRRGPERPAHRVRAHGPRDVLCHVRDRTRNRSTQIETQKGCAMSARQLEGHIVLVTGALGTLGSAMCKAIEAAGGMAIRSDLASRGKVDIALDVTKEEDWKAAAGRDRARRTAASTASSTTPASARPATSSRRPSPSGGASWRSTPTACSSAASTPCRCSPNPRRRRSSTSPRPRASSAAPTSPPTTRRRAPCGC